MENFDNIYKEECDEILISGEYMSHKYVIRTLGRYPTAYVSVNKLPNDNYAINCVYGGITYRSTDSGHLAGLDKSFNWIGWDYGHCIDYILYRTFEQNGTKHTLEEIERCCKDVITCIVEKGLD